MFGKLFSFKIDDYEFFNDLVDEGVKRVAVDDSGVVTVIKNNESLFLFNEYTNGELTKQDVVSNSFGVLAGYHIYNGERWLEFHDHIAVYEEEYNIVRLYGENPIPTAIFTRESYQHSQQYHRMFAESDSLYLYIIKHSRVHVYKIGNTIEEVDVLEGGTWFLCGSHLICVNGGSIELYDSGLNLNAIFDNDLDIDEVIYAENETKNSIAIAFNDHTQGTSNVICYHDDSNTFGVKSCEFLVHDIGLSAGRIWINPKLVDYEADFGGYVILDKYADPLFSHTKTKALTAIGMGGVPLPMFHRSEGIFPLKDGATMIADKTHLIIVDHSCRVIQEIAYSDLRFVAVSPDCSRIVVMNIDKKLLDNGDGQENKSNNDLTAVTVDCYLWNSAKTDDKVINMTSFMR